MTSRIPQPKVQGTPALGKPVFGAMLQHDTLEVEVLKQSNHRRVSRAPTAVYLWALKLPVQQFQQLPTAGKSSVRRNV